MYPCGTFIRIPAFIRELISAFIPNILWHSLSDSFSVTSMEFCSKESKYMFSPLAMRERMVPESAGTVMAFIRTYVPASMSRPLR